MPSRRALTIAPAALSGVLLLGGCWAQDSEVATTEPSAELTAEATTGASEAASAPASEEASAPAGEATTDEYKGVTVTGVPGGEPTVTLADDFAPAQELATKDLVKGDGDPVEAGAQLTVHYVGVGQQSRQVFDSSWSRGEPASFPLDGVIQGWQQGMLGMQPGGRRVLIIPGSLAYGPTGSQDGSIAPDETLVFVVDLLESAPAS